MRESFKGAGISRSKLSQRLVNQGFNPAGFFESGISDIALSVILIDQQGKGFITIRGTARLADVDHAYLVTSFKGGGKNQSKLTKRLMEQGFNPGGFLASGIPDIALSVILGYYAMHAGKRCTEQAKLAYEAFSAI